MVAFTKEQLLAADASGLLTNVADMEILSTGSGPMLYLATDRGGGLSAYRIGADGCLALDGTAAYAAQSASLASTELLTVQIGGGMALLPTGAYDQTLTAYGMNADGSLTGTKSAVLSAPVALPGQTAGAVSVTLGGVSYVYTAQFGTLAPVGYGISDAASLSPVAGAAGVTGSDGTITAMAAADCGGSDLLLAGVSGGGDRLVSFRIGAEGALTQADVLGAGQGLPVGLPTAIATADVDGESYAILGAAGNSSLSVVRLGADGQMAATDQVMDDLNTRFADVQVVETVEAAGHDFVLAAGSDDGISLFALLPGGRLAHMASVADQTNTTLAHVSALSAIGLGDGIDVFATSASEAGLTGLHVDLSGFGDILAGGKGGLVSGTGKDDILIAADGADVLHGGAGADLFVFDPAGAAGDGTLGTVQDFEAGRDRLDLSGLPRLYSAEQVSVETTDTGAVLRYGGYSVVVNAALPGPLTAEDFTTASLLNAAHQAVGLSEPHVENTLASTPAGVSFAGTGGRDNVTGDLGNDSLGGGAGDDTIAGLDGNDTIRAGDGADVVLGGAGDDLIYGGDGAADGNDTIDAGEGLNTVTGGWGNDRISAGAGDDLLVGAEGNDWINGGDGQNTLRGGDGQDTVIGGSGADFILAGDDTLDLRDVVYAGGGNDTIDGGYGNDSLSGGDGADIVDGGFGADTLVGNSDDDTLSGGPLSDLIFGGPGRDFLNGGFGYDRLNGGDGADVFYHQGLASHGSDWVQDYDAGEGDVLFYGRGGTSASQFQVNYAETEGAGAAGVAEAFVIHKPSGQIVWALVDGAGAEHIELQIAGNAAVYDLIA